MNAQLKAKILEKYERQWKFADAVKMDETLVSRIVQRSRPLTPKDRAKWAKALGCAVNDPIFGPLNG